MSLENRGVFQLLKEVTFRRILAFYSSYSDIDNLIGITVTHNTVRKDMIVVVSF